MRKLNIPSPVFIRVYQTTSKITYPESLQENCSSANAEESSLAHFGQPSFTEPLSLSVTNTTSSAKSRQAKRKLLDSIPEPPPLSPLPSSIPASVRREFKRPGRVQKRGTLRLKQ